MRGTEPAPEDAPPPDVTRLRQSLSRGETCQMGRRKGGQLRWKLAASRQRAAPVTLRGTSGRGADKMRSDMPSPLLSVMPPH